jgi:hypothetical protein
LEDLDHFSCLIPVYICIDEGLKRIHENSRNSGWAEHERFTMEQLQAGKINGVAPGSANSFSSLFHWKKYEITSEEYENLKLPFMLIDLANEFYLSKGYFQQHKFKILFIRNESKNSWGLLAHSDQDQTYLSSVSWTNIIPDKCVRISDWRSLWFLICCLGRNTSYS